MNKILLGCMLVPALAMAKVPDAGFYTEIGTGVSSINYLDTNSSSWLVRIDGGYNVNKYVGFQVGVNNYFSTTMTNNTYGTYNLSGYGADIVMVPNMPLGGQNAPINVFAKLGMGYDAMSASVGNQNSTVDVLGLGIRYDISAHITVSAQWMGRGLIAQTAPANYYQNDFLATFGVNF